jgi:enoyl-[acyl-carrier protein] reductase I
MKTLQLTDKTFLITGVANRKSIAFSVAKSLEESGARVILTFQNDDIAQKTLKLFPDVDSYIVDVENQDSIDQLRDSLKEKEIVLDGFLHSMAYANYLNPKPFHETSYEDYVQADRISHFSLIALSNSLKDIFNKNASVVTMSISNTRVTSYGYMGPIKATLDASVSYLAKSFSAFSKVRFNAVCAGPLKTSASSGIPGYIDNYLYAEKLTLRKEALKTEEVANTALFLLSPLSTGINATGITVDAGMSCNYFDQDVVKTTVDNS